MKSWGRAARCYVILPAAPRWVYSTTHYLAVVHRRGCQKWLVSVFRSWLCGTNHFLLSLSLSHHPWSVCNALLWERQMILRPVKRLTFKVLLFFFALKQWVRPTYAPALIQTGTRRWTDAVQRKRHDATALKTKMNRVINLSRTEPNEDDLIESA